MLHHHVIPSDKNTLYVYIMFDIMSLLYISLIIQYTLDLDLFSLKSVFFLSKILSKKARIRDKIQFAIKVCISEQNMICDNKSIFLQLKPIYVAAKCEITLVAFV